MHAWYCDYARRDKGPCQAWEIRHLLRHSKDDAQQRELRQAMETPTFQQETEEMYHGWCERLGHLVEEQRALVGLFEEAGARLVGPGVGAARMSEQLRLEQFRAEGRAVWVGEAPHPVRS